MPEWMTDETDELAALPHATVRDQPGFDPDVVYPIVKWYRNDTEFIGLSVTKPDNGWAEPTDTHLGACLEHHGITRNYWMRGGRIDRLTLIEGTGVL